MRDSARARPRGSPTDYPLATMVIYGSRRDHHRHAGPDPEGRRVRCSRPAGGGRATVLTYDASDNDRHPQRPAGDRRAHDARRAALRLPAPRPVLERRRRQRSPSPPACPTATHAARIVAEDAAGNATVAQRDRSSSTAPRRRPCSSAQAAARSSSPLTDAASGVAGATLEVRNKSTEPYRTLEREGRERPAHRQARPRPRLARRHARNGPRRGGQRRAGQPDPSLGHEREGRPAHPQGPLRPRQGALRPHARGSAGASRSPRPGARGPDDRRDGRRSAAAARARSRPAAR